MRRVAFALYALACTACGDGSLLYIERLVPFDGPSAALVDADIGAGISPDGIVDRNLINPAFVLSSESNAVDTTLNICVINDECSSEFYTAHFAWVTVRNDQPPVDGLEAQDVINSYQVEFVPETTGPSLPTLRGNVRGVVSPGERITLQTTLVPFEWKDIVGPTGQPRVYRARMTLTGERSLELNASTTLLIGPFNKCTDGGEAIAERDRGAFCSVE